jgi:hypothetical protein
LGDLGIDEGALLKLNLKNGRMSNGFVWLSTKTSEGVL